MNFYGHDVSQWKKQYPYFSFENDARIFTCIMGGAFTDVNVSQALDFYAIAQTGWLYANFPNFIVRDGIGEQAFFTAPWSSALAYNIGIGVRYRLYDITVRYFYGSLEYDATYQYRRDKIEFLPVKKPIRTVHLMVGLYLN